MNPATPLFLIPNLDKNQSYVAKPENAALVAIRIFALTNPELKEQLDKFKQKMAKAVYDGAEEVKKITEKKDVNRLAV